MSVSDSDSDSDSDYIEDSEEEYEDELSESDISGVLTDDDEDEDEDDSDTYSININELVEKLLNEKLDEENIKTYAICATSQNEAIHDVVKTIDEHLNITPGDLPDPKTSLAIYTFWLEMKRMLKEYTQSLTTTILKNK
jgi:hypothetical protein